VIEGHRDAKGREVYLQRVKCVPGEEGHSIQLTLDQNIQHIVEKELKKVVEKYTPKGAWCIVEDVHNGEILAMASMPGYDLNEFRTASDLVKLNRAISYVYEPGSTMKAASFAAALNERLVTPNTMFSCEGGAWLYKGRILHDCHDYGIISVADGLKKSSNILTAKLSLMLGKVRLYRYLHDFGIGSKMGIDLPGEESGIFHPVSKWSGLSPTRIAIGQGVAVTALQMLGVYCTIANDGYLMKPHVIKRIEDCQGNVTYEAKPQVLSRVIRPETARTMCRLLSRVTEEHGTGTRARIKGYKVAGKTGTAQKPVRGGYSSTAYMSSFVGFFPADNPEIGIIVVVDEPRKAHYGGVVAAPAFSAIGESVARYLGIHTDGVRGRVSSVGN
jgi:cell division protein FtsI (penicillin-binding protein 3)